MSANLGEDIYPIAVLIEELRNEDLKQRLHSITNLTTIALALGPEKTRTKLVPFLKDIIFDDENVLLVLAEQLGQLVPFVGGPEYADILLGPLETLACVDDNPVREETIKSIRAISQHLTPSALETNYMALLERLAKSDNIPGRISACYILSSVYSRVSASTQARLLNVFECLLTDEKHLVRRSIAGQIGELASAMCKTIDESSSTATSDDGQAKSSNEPLPRKRLVPGSEFADRQTIDLDDDDPLAPYRPTPLNDAPLSPNHVVWKHVMPSLIGVLRDEQENVRLMAVESLAELVKLFGRTEEFNSHFKSLVDHASSDESWRVRCNYLNKLIDMFQSVGRTIGREYLLPGFLTLARDGQSEVRALAASHLGSLAYCLLDQKPPPSSANNEGGDDDVRYPGGARSSLPTTATTNNRLDPPSSALVDPSPELDCELQNPDNDILILLLPVAKKLADDDCNHVRLAVIDSLFNIALLFGPSLTNKHLIFTFNALLCDTSEIRLKVISQLDRLMQAAGSVEKQQQQTAINGAASSPDNDLFHCIVQATKFSSWRVRRAVIAHWPAIIGFYGDAFVADHLNAVCRAALTDNVHAVREAAISNCVKLAKQLGPTWISDHFWPNVAVELLKDANYMRRMVFLFLVNGLAEIVDSDITEKLFLPAVMSMQNDNVPNVRFKVAQSLGKIYPFLNRLQVESDVEACLSHLATDKDRDVRFFALQSMQLLHLNSSKVALDHKTVQGFDVDFLTSDSPPPPPTTTTRSDTGGVTILDSHATPMVIGGGIEDGTSSSSNDLVYAVGDN